MDRSRAELRQVFDQQRSQDFGRRLENGLMHILDDLESVRAGDVICDGLRGMFRQAKLLTRSGFHAAIPLDNDHLVFRQ